MNRNSLPPPSLNSSKGPMKRLVTNFFRGLALVVPVAATLYVLWAAFQLIDGLLPVHVPGLGFVIIVCAITLLGAASPLFLGNPLIAWAQGMLERVPLVKLIYTAVKDLMAAFVGDKKRFNEPVLVTMNKDCSIKKLGFLTQRDLSQLGLKDQVAVYLPHSYNFSGNLFIVSKDAVMPLNVSGSEAMKFIVSGGVTDI